MKTGSHSVGVPADGPRPSNTPRRASEQRHTARNIVIVVAIVVVVIALCGVSLYTSAQGALADAKTLQQQASTLESQVSKNQVKRARSTARELGATASDMHDKMSNPLWRVAVLVPGYGGELKKVIDLAGVADDLANNALVPVLQNVKSLDASTFVKKNGNLNVDQIVPIVQSLGNAAPVIQRCNNTVTAMEDSSIQQLNTPIAMMKIVLPSLNEVSQLSSKLSPVIDDVLGAKGKRTYLLVAQNNVEMRSVGGFPGSMGPLTINKGKVKLGKFKSVYDYIPRLDKNPLTGVVTSEERKIFSKRMAYIPGDTGQIVDFERVATIWNAEWDRSNKTRISGIVAVDPVFLQDLLKLTGGFTAANGWKVNGKNAASVLMNQSYTGMPIEQTDAFFASVAGQAFKKVRSDIGNIDVMKLASTVSDGADQGRIRVWMKNNEEQAAMRSLGLTGELSDDMGNPVLGVYVSDYAWSKIGWYLDRSVRVGKATKNADGTSSYDVTVTLKNTMTDGQFAEAAKAGTYIYGQNPVKRSKDDMVYFLYLTAPAGGTIGNVKASGYFGPYSKINHSRTLDGKKHNRTMAETSYNARDIWGGETQIKRGKKTTVKFTVTVPGGGQSGLKVAGTPSANPDLRWSVKYN